MSRLGEALRCRAPLPAAEAMAEALYHPRLGYYRKEEGPWGFADKDYYTALDCGPLMGLTLAVRLERVWTELGCPGVFTVLEPGAGRGWLGRDLLASATGAFGRALRYIHRDGSPAARRSAEVALAPWLGSGQARLVEEDEPLTPFEGAVVSNELFDALPAQPYRFRGGHWERELLMSEGSNWEPVARDEAVAWFEGAGIPEEGDGSVWCPSLPAVLAHNLAALGRGAFIAIDYGGSTGELLEKGADLRRYRAHRVDGRWWEDLGEADLTADVDFTRLATLLEGERFVGIRTRSLSTWVREHAPLSRWEVDWQELEPRERLARMQNLMQLTLPNLMGERFRVLEGLRA